MKVSEHSFLSFRFTVPLCPSRFSNEDEEGKMDDEQGKTASFFE
jgi:hypothetical protein